jgi:hypothetical protein
MKKYIAYGTVVLFPFLVVWLSFFMTAFSFDPRFVFKQDWFFGLSVMYYIFFCPLVLYAVSETKE